MRIDYRKGLQEVAPAISLEKVAEQAPALVDLYKHAAVSLAKNQVGGERAAVYLVLDRSGSMRRYHRDGSVQHLAEQTLALAAFWQFVGFGDDEFRFLRKLDDLPVPGRRVVDNAGSFAAGSAPKAVSDADLHDRLLREFPQWPAPPAPPASSEAETTSQARDSTTVTLRARAGNAQLRVALSARKRASGPAGSRNRPCVAACRASVMGHQVSLKSCSVGVSCCGPQVRSRAS